jgi:chemotaxis protein methyltransferase CheR
MGGRLCTRRAPLGPRDLACRGATRVGTDVTPRPAELSETVFRLFAELVRRRTGFVVAESQRSRLESRLLADARSAGSFYQLYTLWRDLPSDSTSFGRLVDACVNGETYFFRDPDGLSAFVEELAPERLLAAGPEGMVHVWSAGCSSGEEPYTLAMLLLERGILPNPRIRIRGSDVSPDAIRRARAALYGAHPLRATSEDRRARFFEPADGGRVRLKDGARSSVDLEVRGILDEPRNGALFDVILCRNVLIYFDEDARRAAAERFADRLKPGGYLLLGPSDALAAAATSLRLVRLEHDVAYRK